MKAIQRILIPTDFTPGADRALAYGTHLARQLGAEVHLLHILEGLEGHDFPGLPNLEEVYWRLRGVASTTLGSLLVEERRQGLPVQQAVLEGECAAVILDYMAQHEIDLTVMGTHGRQGAARFLIGSTAERLVRFAPASVLTIGPHGEQAPEHTERILVPVDFSEEARFALREAQDLATRFAARLELLHVIEPLPPVFSSDHPLGAPQQMTHIEREARALLKAFAEETLDPSTPADFHSARGRPASEIAAFAEHEHIDLIVQGSRGFTGEADLALGSVAEVVVRLAPCPVFTTKGVAERSRSVPEARPASVKAAATTPGERAVLRIGRILHPTDFSACANAALPCALDLARRSGAHLHVLHVAPVFGEDPIRGAFKAEIDEEAFYHGLHAVADEQMRTLLATYDTEGVPIERSHARGPAPGETIDAYAEAENVDVVVLGTHGRRGMKRLLLGSVALEVIQQVGCPVLTVPGRAGEEEPRCAIRRILAPIDFSAHSIQALAYAKELASLFEASLDFLHVLDPVTVAEIYSVGLENRDRVERAAIEKTRERLEWLTHEVKGPEDLVTTHHVVVGYPPEEIVQHAQQQACDLIVIATHGLTGLKRFMLGSVAERVVQQAACPVFITKPFGKSLLSYPGAAVPEASAQPAAQMISS